MVQVNLFQTHLFLHWLVDARISAFDKDLHGVMSYLEPVKSRLVISYCKMPNVVEIEYLH